ncbi:hypothetical protein 15570_00031 [Lokiarchaeota virus WyrdV1]|nr:hypothetical protein 15570_00031 [Lokiarchaeota virus WyrdV1]
MKQKTKINFKRSFTCDKSIAKGIKFLNKNGFYTVGCCSGLKIDHDNERNKMYIEFAGLSKAKELKVKHIANQFGFNVKNKRILRIESENDDKLEMFNDFISYLKYNSQKLSLRAIGISNWAYDSEKKKRYSIQFYDYDFNGDIEHIPREDLLRILEIFPYDCLMYETKGGVHFISFSILLGLHVSKARVLETSKSLEGQDYWTEGKDLTLRVSAKWKLRLFRKRKIVSKKPKFKGLIKGPDNLIKTSNTFLNSKNPNKYVVSKNHLEFYRKYMDLPDWVYELYADCDMRDLRIKNYHYKTRD